MTDGICDGISDAAPRTSVRHRKPMPPVCLCMIVRDESPVIRRCLKSVRPFITHWAIVDTGSEDDTVAMIQQALHGLPGKLKSQAWTGNFAFHRNECIAMANGIFAAPNLKLLFIDADETVVVHDAGRFQDLIRSRSMVFWWACDGDWRFRKLGIVAAKYVDSWTGVIHESLRLKANVRVTKSVQRAVEVIYGNDGRRRRTPGTYLADVALLDDLLVVRADYRELFFLALTLETTHEMTRAAVQFRRAANLGDITADERWQSLWGLGRVLLHLDVQEACKVFMELNRLAPQRAEPMVALAGIARSQGQFAEACLLAEAALACPEPHETSMYDRSAYGWRAADELCLAAFATSNSSDMRRAASVYERLIGAGDVPKTELDRVAQNYALIQQQTPIPIHK